MSVKCDKEKLINLVCERPAIWDASHKDHSNRYIMDKMWKEIEKNLNIPAKEASKTWKNLRQEFKKQWEKTKNVRSGDAAPDEMHYHWTYFENLLFLKNQFIPRNSTGNLMDGKSTFLENSQDIFDISTPTCTNNNQHESESPEDLPSTPLSAETNRSLSSRGYKRRVTPNVAIGQALLKVEQQKLDMKKQKTDTDKNDEDIGFFNSLLPHVRSLNPRQKLNFRMTVQKALYDLLYEDIEIQSPNSVAIHGNDDYNNINNVNYIHTYAIPLNEEEI